MITARPPLYGEKNQQERDTLAEIVFLRETRRLSYQKVADELNAQSIWPRQAAKWTWILVRHHYLRNQKQPGNNGETP